MDQYDKLTLEVVDYKITNSDKVIEAINTEEDYNKLKEYYEVLKNNFGYNSYENINIILFALESRLKSIKTTTPIEENSPLDELLNIYVTLEDVYPLIRNYLNNRHLEENDLLKIYAYLSEAITKITTLEIDIFDGNTFENERSFENEAIKTLLNHIENKERNTYEEALHQKFNNYIEKLNSSSKGVTNDKRKTYGIPGNPAPLLLGDGGISLTITIITVTIILGALIAAILLVK